VRSVGLSLQKLKRSVRARAALWGQAAILSAVPTVAIKLRKNQSGSVAGARGGGAATALLRGR